MNKPDYTRDYDRLLRSLYRAILFLSSFIVVLALGGIYYGLMGNPFSAQQPMGANSETQRAPASSPTPEANERIEDGIHLATGLRVAEGFNIVRANCTGCHSGKLIAQNRATRDGWQEMIRWMQRTQGLWQLGENEAVILDYLAANYAPREIGRRANLNVEAIEWYMLEE